MEDARENPMIYLIVPFVVVSLVGIALLVWMAWSFMVQERELARALEDQEGIP